MTIISRRSLAVGAAVVTAGACLPGSGPKLAPGRADATLVVEDVMVIDVTNGRRLPSQTVVIAGNRIVAVGPGSRVRAAAGARVVSGTGKYLIPGLWDMHVHIRQGPQPFYDRMLARGVTGVREMSAGAVDSVLRWRREIAAGTRTGPRVVTPGPFLTYSAQKGDGTRDQWGVFSVAGATPADARRLVDSLKTLGVDFIKVRELRDEAMPREFFFALAAEARRVGLPLAGHLSRDVTMAEAADSGQRSIEHWMQFFDPCWQWNWDSLALRMTANDAAPPHERVEAADSGRRACALLAGRLVRRGTWLTPTVVALWPSTQLIAENQDKQQWQQQFAQMKRQVGWFLQRLRRFGMPVLAGTDIGGAFGSGDLVQELEVFAELGGFTPLQALQTATLNPAKYLNATDSLGTVATGKLADLVLLDDDPLADLANLRAIHGIIANGRYFDRAALDRLLTEVQAPGRKQP